MKIALYSDTYYPTVDGVVVSVSYLHRELIKRNHRCLMIVPNQSIKGKYTESHLFLPSVPFWGYKDYRSTALPSREMKYLKKFDPDILNLHGVAFTGFKGIYAASILKKPVISMYHTNVIDSLHYVSRYEFMRKEVKKLVFVYLDWFLRNSDVVVFPTDTARKEMESRIDKKTRYEVIPNAIDIRRLNYYTPQPKTHVNEDSINLFYVGRLALEKNLETLFHAMELLPKGYRLKIAGRGPASEYYKTMVKKLGIENRVEFLGYIDNKKLAELYATSDIFVMPSTFETQGMVALESLYMYTPVVGANFRGLKEIIKDNYNGYLFEPGNSSDMADSIKKAYDNLIRLSSNSRDSIKEYMPDIVINKFIKLFKEFA